MEHNFPRMSEVQRFELTHSWALNDELEISTPKIQSLFGLLNKPTSVEGVQSDGYLNVYVFALSVYVFQSAVGSGVAVGVGAMVTRGVGVEILTFRPLV